MERLDASAFSTETAFPAGHSALATPLRIAPQSTFAALVNEAEKLWHRFAAIEVERYFECVGHLHRALAHIYALHEAGKDSPEEYAAFLKARRVPLSSRALNEYHATVSAFVEAEDRPKMRQRISQYAQVLYVMAKRGVRPEHATEWLGKAERVAGKKASGIAKALRLYSRLPCVQERNKRERARAEAERVREVERILKKLEKSFIGEVADCRALAVYKGQPVVLLGHVETTGSLKLLRVTNDNTVIHSMATRYLGPKR